MMIAAPIQKRADRAYEGDSRMHTIMEAAIRQARMKIADNDYTWKHVRGPAGATIATMESIGWTMDNWQTCQTDSALSSIAFDQPGS